jgi:hypothetical protein
MKFDELSDDAKDTVRQWLMPDGKWYDSVYDWAVDEGKGRGFLFTDKDISFSGFWSQGDGASWTGDIKLADMFEHYAPKEHRELLKWQAIKALCAECSLVDVSTHGRYAHSGTMSATMRTVPEGDDVMSTYPFDGAPAAQAWAASEWDENDLCEWALQCARDFADDIYKALETEYDHMTSDEYLSDLCAANEYDFDEEGELQ